eukprot:COSAG04_NODE_1190_length_7830_cov_2.663433_9_plen_338_part_00
MFPPGAHLDEAYAWEHSFTGESGVITSGSGARIDWDDESGRFVADAEPDVVRADASPLTLCCSIFAFIITLVFWIQIWVQYWAQKPSINEFTTESIGGNGVVAEAPIPDTALTLVLPDMPEDEMLKYVWPEFTWVDITNGFTNRSFAFVPLEPRAGAVACGLDGGYQKSATGQDSGSATWPVFCVTHEEVAQAVETAMNTPNGTVPGSPCPFCVWPRHHGDATNLSGRFGDPSYSHLSIRLKRCGEGNRLMPGLQRLYDDVGGACATQSEVEALGVTNAWQYPVNVWFKLHREDWTKHASDAAYERGELDYQRGPLAGERDNGYAPPPPPPPSPSSS